MFQISDLSRDSHTFKTSNTGKTGGTVESGQTGQTGESGQTGDSGDTNETGNLENGIEIEQSNENLVVIWKNILVGNELIIQECIFYLIILFSFLSISTVTSVDIFSRKSLASETCIVVVLISFTFFSDAELQ